MCYVSDHQWTILGKAHTFIDVEMAVLSCSANVQSSEKAAGREGLEVRR